MATIILNNQKRIRCTETLDKLHQKCNLARIDKNDFIRVVEKIDVGVDAWKESKLINRHQIAEIEQ